MAHQRILKSEFFTDWDVAQMPALHRLFFQGLWCQADRNGALEDKPHQLKVRVMPYDEVDPAVVLDDLVRRNFLIRYRVGNKRYLAIRTWHKNQSVNANERKGHLPGPEEAEEVLEPAKPAECPQPCGTTVPNSCTTAAQQLSTLPVPVPAPSPVPVPVPVRCPDAPAAPPPTPGSLKWEAPVTPPEQWDAADFFRWAQARRIASGLLGEKWPNDHKLKAFWREVHEAGVPIRRLQKAFYRYGEDPFWEAPDVNPKHPWNGFQKEWAKYVEQEKPS